MKKKDLPLNLTEKNRTKVSFIASVVTLALLCLLIHTIDTTFFTAEKAAKAEEALKLQQEQKEKELAASTKTATFLAAGDNFFDENLLNAGKSDSATWDYQEIYRPVSDKISAADLAIVAQPTVLTTEHDIVSGTDSYATPTEVGDALVQAGFDVIASAGDHSDDYGASYLNQALDFWSTTYPDITITGLHKTQEDADTIRVRDVNGIKIAILNYTFGSNYNALPDEERYMVDYFQKEKVSSDITKAKEISDCILVYAQWGEEDSSVPNEYTKQWANFLLSQGVKVVIGAHPHVLQPYEILKDEKGNEMLIYYSLGNFASASSNSQELLGGLAEFTLEKEGDTVPISITAHTLTPVVMHYNSGEDVYQTMLLSDYTDELAAAHSVQQETGDDALLPSNLQTLFTQLTNQTVEPSTAEDLLDLGKEGNNGQSSNTTDDTASYDSSYDSGYDSDYDSSY
ncbi:MAG: CapA family protein [Eubacteriales bacterium]|nr:CapA family protein [Eubacteriales bacterium]